MPIRRQYAVGVSVVSAAVLAGALVGTNRSPERPPAAAVSPAPAIDEAPRLETATVDRPEPQADGLARLIASVLPTAALSAGQPAAARPAPPTIAKVDRLPIPTPKLAPAATRSGATRSPLAGGGLTITTTLEDRRSTVAMPILAYASLSEPDLPFDKLLGPAQPSLPQAQPAKPTEAPPVAEEDDDVVELLPIPRPKPKGPLVAHAEPAAAPMPLPLAKPGLPLANGKPVIIAPKTLPPLQAQPAPAQPPQIQPPQAQPLERPAPAVAAAVPAPPPAEPRNTILALFTPQPEPKTPTAQPPISTPFGVPYVLQTETVETACLRPDLLELLRRIESHYGKKVVITSGYRSRGRPGSLHRRCAAADIIVPGVDSKALSVFARTVPGMGGVGQYCHQAMVHIDVGTPRDWKYGCGSYFAMRDGSASWGRRASSEE